jgi:cell wall assembly regulator SMI1
MRDLGISDSYNPLSRKIIKKVEKELGATFPDAYLNFLLTHNGGKPKINLFPINGDEFDENGIIQKFLGIKDGEYDDITHRLRVFQNSIPENLLPIAYDPGGNLICLSIQGSDRETVYFWDHEDNKKYIIAASFEDFIELLTDTTNNDINYDALEKCCEIGDIKELVNLVRNGADLTYRDQYGKSLIEIATVYKNEEIISYLIENNAPINNALIIAAKNGYSEICEYLLNNGADVNREDEKGNTALISAATYGHSKVVEVLLRYDVDSNHQNKAGQTAISIARNRNDKKVLDVLK